MYSQPSRIKHSSLSVRSRFQLNKSQPLSPRNKPPTGENEYLPVLINRRGVKRRNTRVSNHVIEIKNNSLAQIDRETRTTEPQSSVNTADNRGQRVSLLGNFNYRREIAATGEKQVVRARSRGDIGSTGTCVRRKFR